MEFTYLLQNIRFFRGWGVFFVDEVLEKLLFDFEDFSLVVVYRMLLFTKIPSFFWIEGNF